MLISVWSPLGLALEGGTPNGPGDGSRLDAIHPGFDLMDLRPPGFNEKIAGMDFLPDGRLVVSTWGGAFTTDGKVWILSGVDQDDYSQITATEIASGLHDPLGLKVYDGAIYVSEKSQVTRLVDTNGDDVIDEYQVFSTGFPVTSNFHIFSFGLEIKNGYLWMTLSTCVLGPGLQCPADDPENIADRGSLVRINLDPSTGTPGQWEIVATGLRTPNGIGTGVDGELFGGDNQGTWLPANAIHHYRTDDTKPGFNVNFGHVNNIPSKFQHLSAVRPVIYLDHGTMALSPSQVGLIPSGTIYEGQMVHGDVSYGGIRRDFVEWVEGAYQGVVFRFTQGLEAGVNRLKWHNGDLYVGGIGSTGNWNEPGKLLYGLQRLRPNGKAVFEMLAVRSMANGFEIEFTAPVNYTQALNPANYLIEDWYYIPTAGYGGQRLGSRVLPISQISVSDDYRKVFIELPSLQGGRVVGIKLNGMHSNSGVSPWSTEAHYTLNQVSFTVGPNFNPALEPPEDTPLNPSNPPNTLPGLNYSLYHGNWNSLPDFATETPSETGYANNFDISGSSTTDHFGFVFEGFIEIAEDDLVSFYSVSDDGSRVWIGDELVVDNDGRHAAIEASGIIYLGAGKHPIKVEFFEFDYGESLQVLYSSTTVLKQAIPDSVLFRTPPSQETMGPYLEAENGALIGTCTTSSNPINDQHFVTCAGDIGDSVSIPMAAPFVGNYEVQATYARGTLGASTGDANVDIFVNGVYISTTTFAATSGWGIWGVSTQVLPLNEGFNTIEYRNTLGLDGAINLDKIEVVKQFAGTLPPAIPTACPTTNYGVDCRQDSPAYLAFPTSNPDNNFSDMPPLLSQTGAFSDVANLVPSSRLLPYAPAAKLWSDNALKSRWIALPTGTTIDWSATSHWAYPDGTVLVKHFELPLDQASPSITRRLETRFIIKTSDSWYGATYRWRTDNSDADLLTTRLSDTHTVLAADGTPTTQTWTYPSPQECMTCHTVNTAGPLGLKTGQLNSDLLYPDGLTDNQLRTWNHLAMFDVALDETGLSELVRFASIDDQNATPEHRLQSYWDSNCSHCHGSDDTGVKAQWDARFSTPLSAKGIILRKPISATAQSKYLIDPGNSSNSELLHRSALRGDGQMPPLGTHVRDNQYLELLEQWISALPENNENGLRGEYFNSTDLTNPARSRTDSTINFNWGLGSPEPTLAEDGFSVRWSGTVTSAVADLYTFHTMISEGDGVRLFVNGQLIVDQWLPQTELEASASAYLEAGVANDIVMEYVNRSGAASARLEWSSATVPQQVIPGSAIGFVGHGLAAEYFNNSDLSDPVLTRVDASVIFNWGAESPDPSIDADTFSVRWTGQLEAEFSETYTFYTGGYGGFRLWVDGKVIIDHWTDAAGVYSGLLDLNAGQRVDIQLEYFDNDGTAFAFLGWASASQTVEIIPQDRLWSGSYGAGLLFGTLAGGLNLTDPNPETQITLNLIETEDSIFPQQTEVFSGLIYDADGQISFTEHNDDSTRLLIDGQLVLSSDDWLDRVSTGNLNLTPGWHQFELRLGNNYGGSGPVTSPGFGMDPDGGTAWIHPADPGDGSLFRLRTEELRIFRLKARHSGQCVEVAEQGTANGDLLNQTACNAGNAQLWSVEPSGNFFSLSALHTGKCLEAGAGGSPGSLFQATCSGSPQQQWSAAGAADGQFQLSASQSGECLSVADSAQEDGAAMILASCESGLTSQHWSQLAPDPQSSNMGKVAPDDAIQLWRKSDGELTFGLTDFYTFEHFKDYFLHIEWWVADNGGVTIPFGLDGNSGVINAGRYEIKILNSYGEEVSGFNDAGAIYDFKDANSNEALPPGQWQLYEITLRSPRYDIDGDKVENARMTVDWNGVRVHHDVEILDSTPATAPESASAGPIGLRNADNYGEKPRFRNIWIKELRL
jgi:uncharacterized repeat protein (TIGR03806 family)